jgi:hypothetical protein
MSTGLLLGGPKNGPLAVPRPYPHPDLVAVLGEVLDGERDVRKRAVHVADGGLDVFAGLLAGRGKPELMLHRAGGAELVHDGCISGGEPFIEDAPHHVVGLGGVVGRWCP